MKKFAGLAILTLLFLAAGCAKMGETITIDEISKANAGDALLGRHTAFSIDTIYYDAQGGEIFSTHQAIGKSGADYAAAYEDSEGYTEFLDRGAVYFFDPAQEAYTVLAFYPGMLDEYVDSFGDYLFLTNEGAVIGAPKTENGETRVDVTLSRSDLNAPFLDSLGFGSPDGIRIRYALAPETKEVRGYDLYAVKGSDETRVLHTTVSVLDAPPAAPDYVARLQTPAEIRTVTVVFPDQTENRYQIPRDAFFSMSFPENLGAFLDPEGRTPLGDETRRGEDVRIYLIEDAGDAESGEDSVLTLLPKG